MAHHHGRHAAHRAGTASPPERPRWGHAVQADVSSAERSPDEPRLPVRKRPRVFFWVFLAVQLVFLVWLVTGLTVPSGCGDPPQADCEAAEGIGVTIGAGLIVALWAAVDVIVGMSYLVYRLAKRG